MRDVGVGGVGIIGSYIEIPRWNSDLSMPDATLAAASRFEARMNELLERKAAADAEADARVAGERARHTELRKETEQNG